MRNREGENQDDKPTARTVILFPFSIIRGFAFNVKTSNDFISDAIDNAIDLARVSKVSKTFLRFVFLNEHLDGYT